MGRRFPAFGPERRRAAKPLAVLGLLGGGLAVVGGGIGLYGALHSSASSTPRSSPATASTASPGTTPSQTPHAVDAIPSATAPAAYPVTLQIPSINVNAPMELLGLALDGTLQTPTDAQKPGWFTGSSLPGEPGPVVIAGHVDSYTGPAVFGHLKDVKRGDPITITLSGKSRVTYRVTSVATYAKDKFPTQGVYGPQKDSELRLITCGGAFVKGQYVDNMVVFAKLSAA
jgi:LPXTG-site transpeptidase (sortase) family protein